MVHVASPAIALATVAGVPRETAIAVVVAVVVTASLPLYLYGAAIVINADVVTWAVLVRHLKYIVAGLALTTLPMITWMVPQLIQGFSGPMAVHAFFGLQAYAFLAFALTGIVHIFRAKRQHSLYQVPDRDVDLDDLHEDMGAWRFRLRVGVAGYLVCWIVAYLLGLALLAVRLLAIL